MKKPQRPTPAVIRTLSSTKLASVVGGIPPDPVHQRNHNQTIVLKRTQKAIAPKAAPRQLTADELARTTGGRMHKPFTPTVQFGPEVGPS